MKIIKMWLNRTLFLLMMIMSASSLANTVDHVKLALSFDKYAIPHANFSINNHNLYAMIDTGSTFGFHLEESELKKIKGLKRKQTYHSVDAAGKHQKNIEYVVDNLDINNMNFKQVTVTPYKQWGWLLSSKDELPHGPVAGLGAFIGKQILLDYGSKSLTLWDNANIANLINTDFNAFPYQMTPDGLVFDVEQSGHHYRLILDTGATASIIWKERLKNHKTVSCLLVDPEMDNEGCEATLLDTVSSEGLTMPFAAVVISGNFAHMEKVDGLLGNSFLQNRKVLIDFKNEKIYITDEHKI